MDVFVYISKNKMIFNDVKEYKIDKELGLLIVNGTEKNSKKVGKFFFSITNILYFIIDGEIEMDNKETIGNSEPEKQIKPKLTNSNKKSTNSGKKSKKE